MDLLEVKNISKTYGTGEATVHALKDATFSVPKGEFVAVVGESGSGKSTLLNMIGALDTPTSGKVFIDSKDIFSMKERNLTVFRRRNIGFIFQSFNLIPELTVEQNIIFPVLLDYQKPNKKYLEELLTVLGLKERRNHLPSQLSKMILAEAFTYAFWGCIVGCAIGLPFSKMIYDFLITDHFPYAYLSLPIGSLSVIVLFVTVAAVLAAYSPAKRMRTISVTETINEL